MNIKFAVRVLVVLVAFGQLSYAEQEKMNEEVSTDSYLINHLIPKYADMNLLTEKIKSRPDIRLWPYEMFLSDCLFDNALSGVIANIHSNDPDKKKHAQDIIARMQQELKKYMGLREKRRDELIADKEHYNKLIYGGFFGCVGFALVALAAIEHEQRNVEIVSKITSALSLFACLFSSIKAIRLWVKRGLISISYNDMEDILGVLDAILLS